MHTRRRTGALICASYLTLSLSACGLTARSTPVQANVDAAQSAAAAAILSSAAAAYTSATNVTIDVKGSGFSSSSVVVLNGQSLQTSYTSSSELKATANGLPLTGETLPLLVDSPGGSKTAAIQVWIPASVSASARLLDEASFGPTQNTIAQVQAIGLSAYISQQIATPTTLLPQTPATLPTWAVNNPSFYNDDNWWCNLVESRDQLRQRVAFALSEIFVISYDEVDPRNLPTYWNILANDAFGNWLTLTHDITLSVGMGSYLNMMNSRKPTAGIIANENFARENMQLFNLGVSRLNQDGTPQLDSSGNPIPTYTEAEVEAFARAFTGWTNAPLHGGAPYFPTWIENYQHPMIAVESAHDTSAKVLFNTTLPAGQTAEQDLDGALADIFNHPNVGPFVGRQLIQHLVKSNPSPAYVGRVAGVFADNGSGVRGDMAAVIRAILLDPEARAGDTSPEADDGHLREPILWMANVLRGLGATALPGYSGGSVYTQMDWLAGNLGQQPFKAPSVFNYFPPNFQVQGTSLEGPEFGLETTVMSMERLTIADTIVRDARLGNVAVNLTATGPLGVIDARSGDAAVVNQLGEIFLHGQMSAQMQSTILAAMAPIKDLSERLRVAAYLVITSSQYKIAN